MSQLRKRVFLGTEIRTFNFYIPLTSINLNLKVTMTLSSQFTNHPIYISDTHNMLTQ